MTADLVEAAAWFVVLVAQHVWLRRRLRRHLHTVLIAPFARWVWDTRRTLAALHRAAHLRPYRPIHHTPRHIHEAHHDH